MGGPSCYRWYQVWIGGPGVYKRKQTKQANRSKPVSSVTHGFCFSPWHQVPALSSCPDFPSWCIILYIFYLYFIYYPLSQFPTHKPPILFPFPLFLWECSLTHPPPFPINPYTGGQPWQEQDFSSHWGPTRPSSDTYGAGAMDLSMCTLWMVL